MMYPVTPPPSACKCDKILDPMTPNAPPDNTPGPVPILGCHYGNFGQEVNRYRSRIMVNIERVFNGLRLIDHAFFCRCIERRFDERGNAGKAQPAPDDLPDCNLFGGIKDGWERPAGGEVPPRQCQGREAG